MFHFMGIQFGNCGYKLQQIISDSDGKLVQRTSDILFWVVSAVEGGVLYVPVSKLDIEMNTTVVPSQLLAAYSSRTRALLRKTSNGTTHIPFGGIIVR